MAFKDQRRQKYLSPKGYAYITEYLDISSKSAPEDLADPTLPEHARSSTLWAMASHSLERLLLNYTAGHPIAELADQLPAVIQAFDDFIPTENPPSNEAFTLDITQLEA